MTYVVVVSIHHKGKLSDLMSLPRKDGFPKGQCVGTSVYNKKRKEVGKMVGEFVQPEYQKVSIEFFSSYDLPCLIEGFYLGKKSGLLKIGKNGRLVRIKRRG